VTDGAEEFLVGLSERGYEPLLAKTSGRPAIELIEGTRTTRWVVTLDNGTVTLARGDRAADATVRLDRSLFERMVEGHANATTAVLRGEVQFDGGLDLLISCGASSPGRIPGSRWMLTIDGEDLSALSTDDLQYFATRFFLVPGAGTVYVDPKFSVIRERAGRLLRAAHHPQSRRRAARSDRARGGGCRLRRPVRSERRPSKQGSYSTKIDDRKIFLSYRRESFERTTIIAATESADVDHSGLTFRVHIESHGSAFQPRLLARRRRVFRRRSRCRWAQGRFPDFEHRPSVVERHS
jgi:hypothetical protein